MFSYRGMFNYRRRKVSCYFLKAQVGKKLRLRWMVVSGCISCGNGWGKCGLKRMVMGGWFSSPGFIPGGTPFSLSPEARHAKFQSRSWEGVEARACGSGSLRKVVPEGRKNLHKDIGGKEEGLHQRVSREMNN
jgi:hypothetical protein